MHGVTTLGFDWWLASTWNANPVYAISWVVWVIVSITLHELGHGWAAIRCGDDTPIRLGHMTLNPFVHIPRNAWILFALFGFTWGLMPVSPSNFRGRYDDAKVAAAGPFVNVILFAVCVVTAAAWARAGARVGEPLYSNLALFFWCGAKLNCFGVFFNLIPIAPLDGSRIVADFYPRYNELWQGERGAIAMFVLAGALFYFGADYVWDFADTVSLESIRAFAGFMARAATGP